MTIFVIPRHPHPEEWIIDLLFKTLESTNTTGHKFQEPSAPFHVDVINARSLEHTPVGIACYIEGFFDQKFQNLDFLS